MQTLLDVVQEFTPWYNMEINAKKTITTNRGFMVAKIGFPSNGLGVMSPACGGAWDMEALSAI